MRRVEEGGSGSGSLKANDMTNFQSYFDFFEFT